MVVQFVASMIGTTVAAVAPEITASIHFDSSFMGIYTACLYVGACLSSLVGGNFIIKYGPARIAEYGLLGCSLSLLLCTADWSVIIIGSGLVLGLAKGPLMPANNTMVSHHTQKEHLNFVFSIKQTTGPLGIALGGVMTPYLAVNYGWQVAVVWVAIIGLFGAIWCLAVRKSQDTYTDRNEKINTKTVQESFRMVVGNKTLLRLSIVSIFYQGLATTIMAYLVLLSSYINSSHWSLVALLFLA
ncbi:MAG: MFS transporter [Burkholderiales bacterium]|nr:MFS transporter [Burkholderiales bacterium]